MRRLPPALRARASAVGFVPARAPAGALGLIAALVLSVLAEALGLAAPLAAAQVRPGRARQYAYITVESRYGMGRVTGAVRQGPSGRLEVRLPGGTWIECALSCHDTLRRETVDFWQDRGHPRGGPGDGPGYLHFEF